MPAHRPPRAERVAVELALAAFALALPVGAQQPQPTPQYQEHVEVQTVMLEVRVVDSKSEPVRGLGVGDFRVTVGGVPVVLDDVAWEGVPDREEIAERLLAGEDVGKVPLPPPRLIVLFYQAGDDHSRIVGHLRMARQMDDLVDSLELDDKVAVVALGSQLRVALDFTTDRDALLEAMKVTTINSDVPRPYRYGTPSITANLDWRAAAKASTPETAIRLLAEALEMIPGPKTMLMLGWGIGHLTRSGVALDADYGPAREALARSHTTVFTLDVTDAASHSLEVGLEQIAEDTGGTYSKTHEFPKLAIDRIERAMLGHYVIAFARPDLPDGSYPLKVVVDRKKVDVLCESSIVLRH